MTGFTYSSPRESNANATVAAKQSVATDDPANTETRAVVAHRPEAVTGTFGTFSSNESDIAQVVAVSPTGTTFAFLPGNLSPNTRVAKSVRLVHPGCESEVFDNWRLYETLL